MEGHGDGRRSRGARTHNTDAMVIDGR
jgi:hypothetical protein